MKCTYADLLNSRGQRRHLIMKPRVRESCCLERRSVHHRTPVEQPSRVGAHLCLSAAPPIISRLGSTVPHMTYLSEFMFQALLSSLILLFVPFPLMLLLLLFFVSSSPEAWPFFARCHAAASPACPRIVF